MIAFIWHKDYEALAKIIVGRLTVAGKELKLYVYGAKNYDYARFLDGLVDAYDVTAAADVQGTQDVLGAPTAPDGQDASDGPDSAGHTAQKSAVDLELITWHDNLAQVMSDATTVISLLGSGQEVEDVYLGAQGVLEHALPASLFIDLSTTSHKLAKEIYALAAVHDHHFVEAPVFGAPDMLESGIFKLLAAGEPDDVAKALDVLRLLSADVVEVGLAGSGMACKLALQIALAGALMGLVESISYLVACGVKKDCIIELLNANPSTAHLAGVFGKRIIDEDFYFGFDMNFFFNDLSKALEAADGVGVALPGLETAHQLYDLLVLIGGQKKGIHALALIYYDEKRCAKHGLNWELAQKAMDVYERPSADSYDEYYYDDDTDGMDLGSYHSKEDEPPSMGRYFSSN